MANDHMSALGSFLSAYDSLEDDWSAVFEGISQANKELEDMLHEIELTEFNACQGYFMARKVKEIRQRRRELKNDQELLKIFKDFLDQHTGLKIPMHETLQKMRDILKLQNNCVYHKKTSDDVIV
jgi:hypothetical protein